MNRLDGKGEGMEVSGSRGKRWREGARSRGVVMNHYPWRFSLTVHVHPTSINFPPHGRRIWMGGEGVK